LVRVFFLNVSVNLPSATCAASRMVSPAQASMDCMRAKTFSGVPAPIASATDRRSLRAIAHGSPPGKRSRQFESDVERWSLGEEVARRKKTPKERGIHAGMLRRRATSRGLIAAPWTSLGSLCCRRSKQPAQVGQVRQARHRTRSAPCQMEDRILENKTRGLDTIGFIEASSVGWAVEPVRGFTLSYPAHLRILAGPDGRSAGAVDLEATLQKLP